jgi:hypothetical protein
MAIALKMSSSGNQARIDYPDPLFKVILAFYSAPGSNDSANVPV